MKKIKFLALIMSALLSVNFVWGETEKYTFSSFDSADDVTLEATNYTINMHKNGGGTAPTWNSNSFEARLYAKGSLVISSTKTITKIEYNYVVNANKSGNQPTIDGVSGGTDSEGTWDGETKIWTGSSKEVTFSTGGSAGNLGFKWVEVTFASAPAVHYTVTLLNNGQPVNKGGFDTNGQKDYVSGTQLGELPTLTSAEACDAKSNHFMGWYNGEPIRTKQPTAPAPTTMVTSATVVTRNMTLRAVWAREQ